MGGEKMPNMIRRSTSLALLALASLALGGSASAGTTLYDDLGGKDGVTAITAGMIDNALKDDRIKAIFDDVNIPRLKGLLYLQFCKLTDGGCEYKRRSMHDTHAGLHLHDADFNALVEDLEDSMDQRHIPWSTQVKLLAILAPMEREIVKQ
jgi:hemoglobin